MDFGVQRALEDFAIQSGTLRAVFIFCATTLLYALVAGWVVVMLIQARRLTLATAVRVVLLLGLAFIIATLLGTVVSDPRPFLVDHRAPLTSISTDNGFPSDHVLLASALTVTLWWIDRRWLVPFALATLLIMCGRMGIGAHHLEDVLGSAVICVGVGVLLGLVPLRGPLERRLWGAGQPKAGPTRERRPLNG